MAKKRKLPTAKVEYAHLTCHQWLIANGYEDIAKLIDRLMLIWASAGSGTRRDWYLILAGNDVGGPRIVNGIPFPVLKAMRRRQGFPPDVEGAIERSPHELAPPIKAQQRWGSGFKRSLK